jgi:DNA (cytosine-5)-methyltransferase 1
MSNLLVGSFFAGIGGICKGLELSGFGIAFANECDKKACESYRANHPHIKLIEARIENIKFADMPNFNIFAGGFPCQPYSLAGKMNGLTDIRGKLFFDIVEVLKNKSPEVILLENVPNLLNTNDGEDFKVINEHLVANGYHIKYQILGGHTHANIPQCRNRLFIVGFKSKERVEKFAFPTPVPLTKTLSDVVDFTSLQSKCYYYTTDSQYYNMLNASMNNNSIYQMRRVYVRENKNNLCPTLTANMGAGGHNVPLIRDAHGIRKLTPDECFKLQGITDFKQVVANSHAYKQAGNSVIRPLITRIGEEILKVI